MQKLSAVLPYFQSCPRCPLCPPEEKPCVYAGLTYIIVDEADNVDNVDKTILGKI